MKKREKWRRRRRRSWSRSVRWFSWCHGGALKRSEESSRANSVEGLGSFMEATT
jgi:hypothetical protein